MFRTNPIVKPSITIKNCEICGKNIVPDKECKCSVETKFNYRMAKKGRK